MEPGRPGVVLGIGRISHVGIISGLCRPPYLLLECRCVYIEDCCSQETVVEGLLLEGAKWANGSLQLSDELRCSLPPCKLKWQLKGQRKVSSGGSSSSGGNSDCRCSDGGGSSSSSGGGNGGSSGGSSTSGSNSSGSRSSGGGRCQGSGSSSRATAVLLVVMVVVAPLSVL